MTRKAAPAISRASGGAMSHAPETTERVFVGRTGEPMRGDAIRQAFTRARTKVGMNDFRFHDLRHTGQTLAAATGATSPTSIAVSVTQATPQPCGTSTT
jgi:integrase